MKVGSRAEDIAMSLVLEVEEVVDFQRVTTKPGQKTPDWRFELSDGRLAALEVTQKQTPLTYEDWDGVRVGSHSTSFSIGDLGDFERTVLRKMKDKVEHGQLADTSRESWLCVQLDQDASSQLESSTRPVVEILITTYRSGQRLEEEREKIRMPCFDAIIGQAQAYGLSEVWCITQSRYGTGSTLVLRLCMERGDWTIWQRRPKFYWPSTTKTDDPIASQWPVGVLAADRDGSANGRGELL